MVKRASKLNFQYKTLTNKQKAIVLPAMVVIGAVVVGLAVWTVVVMPQIGSNNQYGVAANGFTAGIDKNADLGVGKIVTKSDVSSALGHNARSVNSSDVSSVFNYNGDRGQTATYYFTRADGQPSTVYVDMTQFQSQATMDNENIFAETKLLRIVNGHATYYMHTQTLGNVREYRVLTTNGLKAYKFVIDQPLSNVTIDELTAAASLVKLVQLAKI